MTKETLKYLKKMKTIDFDKLGFVYGKETEYEGLTVKIEKTKSEIRIFKRTKIGWLISKYKEYADLDTLYDLIQAGLVEKV